MRDRKAAQTSSDEIATDRPDVTNSRAAPTNRRWRPNLSFCRASKGRQSSSRCATSGYVGVNSASILARFVSVCGKPMRVYGAVCRTETSILNGSRVTGSSRFFPALKQRPRSPHESPVANKKDGLSYQFGRPMRRSRFLKRGSERTGSKAGRNKIDGLNRAS